MTPWKVTMLSVYFRSAERLQIQDNVVSMGGIKLQCSCQGTSVGNVAIIVPGHNLVFFVQLNLREMDDVRLSWIQQSSHASTHRIWYVGNRQKGSKLVLLRGGEMVLRLSLVLQTVDEFCGGRSLLYCYKSTLPQGICLRSHAHHHRPSGRFRKCFTGDSARASPDLCERDAGLLSSGRRDVGLMQMLPFDEHTAPWLSTFTAKYADLGVQLADACLVYLAEREGIDQIFTLDRRDFSVYRFGNDRAFTLLPKAA